VKTNSIALPIDARISEITSALSERNLVIVAEPGAGKTTRVPRALLETGWGERGEIIVLEPRRIAARMAARRVAEELGEELGKRVGYTVRFEDVSSRATRLRFVTEGVLTRRLVADPELTGVSVIVIDELHERSLHADIALSLTRMLQRTSRPDLRLIAMSATMDAERVGSFLEGEIVRVDGRPFDVAIEYAESNDDRPLERRVAAAVRRLLREEADGHVLAFLPGASEIRRTMDALGTLSFDVDVLALHGDLPPTEQDRAVRPSARRKVILATNVAETSLTIDGVVAVVDSGLARVARHSPWSGLPTLGTVPICQASATQRAGRAGRTRQGRALRLYTKHDYETRPRNETPEIQRAELSETLLALRARGVTDVLSFGFFEAPPRPAIEAAERLLALLGAVDHDGRITEMGRDLLKLPLHPRLSRLVLESERRGLATRGALLAAMLGERDLRLSARTRLSSEHRVTHESGRSDAIHRLESLETAIAYGVSKENFRAHDLDVAAGFATVRAHEQILRALRRRGSLPPVEVRLDEEETLERALLSAFPDRVAKRRRPREPDVLLAGGGSAKLAETSVVREPELMIVIDAEERRGTIDVRAASTIEPEWLLEMFPEAIEDQREIRVDPLRGRLEKISSLRYLGLTLDESRGDAMGEPDAAMVLAKAALAAGIERWVDADELTQLERRLDLARRVDPMLPQLDEALIHRVLVDACTDRRSLDELKDAFILDRIKTELGQHAMMTLEKLAPAFWSLPGRRRMKIQYEPDRPPWVESRLQDFFGLTSGPRIGGEPVVLHLLAPNHRAVQVTTDLSGFWERHYPQIRKELMRRYPRHSWPEDPRTATPPEPKR
jgi:ATP-dependent helicase HrpB